LPWRFGWISLIQENYASINYQSHQMRELEGKVCLVTGGSRGIGHAIVEALANAGANVALTYHYSTEAASELVKSIEEKGVKCRAYKADVANSDEMRSIVEQVVKEFGHITVLVNNAGITRDKSFFKMTNDMWQDVMHVDLDGVFYTTQLVAQDMVQEGCGRIINIASIVGQTGNFGQANYAAAKGAVIALTESLARELARKGIKVNAVAPGSGFVTSCILCRPNVAEILCSDPVLTPF
jgi:NAD(P)-dependent dehydrogenase (short-subunit alcohol dehydrogenase family)